MMLRATLCSKGRKVLLSALTFFALGSVSTGAAANLLKNPGFEQMNEEGSFPRYWGMNPAYKGECTVERDAALAHRGSIYLKMAKPAAGQVAIAQGRFSVGAVREVFVSVWTKGRGKLLVLCYLYGRGKFLQSVGSKAMEVNSKGWKKHLVHLTIPDTAGHPPEKVTKFALALHIEGGPVWLDDAALHLGQPPEEKQLNYFQPGRSPLLTVPRVHSPPQIDGRIQSGEWEGACSATGFRELGGPLAERQTTVYIAFDEKKLYFAFRCPQEGRFRDGPRGRDIRFGPQMEAVEIWLQPPGKGWFQFLGVPAGGFLDGSSERGEAWDANWEYASRVEDTGEIVGGILTFAKKVWTAEVSVSFSDLGVSTPQEGEVWRLNFCRDFSVEPGRSRNPEDWTTWSFVQGNFATPQMFGYARFSRKAPGLQILQLGDLKNGNLSIRGKVSGAQRGRVEVQTVVSVREGRKTILDRIEPLATSPGQVIDFALTETLKVSRTTEMTLLLAVQDVTNDLLLAQMEVPFTCVTSLYVKPILVYARGFVEVSIDASRLALPPDFSAQVEIPGTGLSWQGQMGKGDPQARCRFNITALKPGDYLVKASLADPQGKVLASSSEPLPIPERPVWLGNKIGLSDQVPPPWGPIKVSGQSVLVTDREYRLGNNGLPSQIVGLGKPMFAGPAVLKAVVNGQEVVWTFKPLKKVAQSDQEVTWQVEGHGGGLVLTGSLRVEFDGFGLYRFKIASPQPSYLDSLMLEFPLTEDFALYARARRGLPPSKSCYASLYRNTFSSAEEVAMGDGGQWVYSPAWKWSDVFFNEVWVGDDERGFAIMSETDKNIRGPRYAQFLQEGKQVTLRINLISERTVLEKPLAYEYAYQATPARPRPQDPKRWHASYFANWPDEYLDRLYVACQYHLLAHTSYPQLHDSKQTARTLERPHQHGVKVVPDSHPAGAAVETPEFKLFGYEWEAIPRSGWSGFRDTVRVTCYASSYPDFMLYTVKKWVEEFNLDGIYIDSGTAPCENAYHGCGYTDEEGNRHPTLPLWATREFYQRLYTYLHTGGREGVIFSHTMHETLVSGFQDVVTQGEEWCVEKERQYRRLSPDMFRAKEMFTQYGTPFTWYAFHQYSWRGDRYGGPVPFNEILMMCLPHRIFPTIGDRVGGEKIMPVWDLFDEWWTTSKFIPYWSPASPVKTNAPEYILASTYLKPKQALVVVSNWSYKPQKAQVAFDWQGLGLDGRRAKVTEALTGKVPAVDGDRVSLALPARDLAILLVDAGMIHK
ncbi:MAG TPA: hypothetical protein EYP85_06630 [Armatimonadetes bacterium]|nr:hypothetical protein [Armatimonadota bacterium]